MVMRSAERLVAKERPADESSLARGRTAAFLRSRAEVPRASTDVVLPTFDELYTRYFDLVWRLVRRFGVQPALVEDAAQDTFIVVHRRLGSLRPDASPKAFVVAIALRVAHDYRRTARRKGTTSVDESELATLDGSPYDLVLRAQAGQLVATFLDSLGTEHRAVFVLAELEGMTAPEISELLSVNLSTVYTRLRAARQRFVSFLDAQENGHG